VGIVTQWCPDGATRAMTPGSVCSRRQPRLNFAR
jgi:hypothetical protein